MKKSISVFLIFLFTHSAGAQQKDTSATKASRLKSPTATEVTTKVLPKESLFFAESVYDFGKIPQGNPVQHVFTFKNMGSEPLSIDNVMASCGCTTPVWEKEVLQPGDTSSILVGYNAVDEGVFNRTITVFYNGNLIRQLSIEGEVFGASPISAPKNKLVKLINQNNKNKN